MPKSKRPSLVCPDGHGLPHAGAFGACSPIFCGEKMGDEPKALVRSEPAKQLGKKAITTDTPEAREEKLLNLAKTRLARRKDLVGTPDNLAGQDAEDWADKRLVELLPYAVAELEYQLKFGDDGQREKAADKVLNATGRGKREAAQGGGPTIILVGAQGGRLPVPWAKRIEEKVVDVLPSDTPGDDT